MTLSPTPAAPAAATPVPAAAPTAAPLPKPAAPRPASQPVEGSRVSRAVPVHAATATQAVRAPEQPAAAGEASQLPLPVVPRPPHRADGRRPVTRAKGIAAPVDVPERAPAAAPARGRRPAEGIRLTPPHARAPQHPAKDGGAGGRPLAHPAEGRTPAPAAATATAAPVSEGAPVHAAEHAAPAAATQLPRVRVHELAESMHALVKVANRRGTAAARITLRPAELGGVQVRLRAHAGGVSASLTAQTAAGAQALGAAHGELRRALESQGIAVHTIDVQLAGDGPGPDGRPHEWQPGGGQGSPHQPAHEDDEEFEPHHTIEPSRLPLAAGQVDVLA